MNSQKHLLLTCICSTVIAANAAAMLNLSVTVEATAVGSDPNGFDGSSWTFQFNSSQSEYVPIIGRPTVITDSATLTISGVTNSAYNGVWNIVDIPTTNFSSYPNQGGTAYVGLDSSGGSATFEIGSGLDAIQVTDVLLQGSPVVDPAPGTSATIKLSDWQGLAVSDTTIVIDGNVFSFSEGTVFAAVPEPSTYAVMLGIVMLGFAAIRRRR